MAVEGDPTSTAVVGVAEQGRVERGAQGRSAIQDQRNEQLQGVLVKDSYSEERTAEVMSPGQHAAPQIPQGKMSCTPQQAAHADDVPSTAQWQECQRQQRIKVDVHYSLVPWNQIVDEIKNHRHPWPIREGNYCRNPKCGCLANENVEEFCGYCCKQCALRLREEQYGIVHENPKPFQLERHGPHCQGKKLKKTDEVVSYNNEAMIDSNKDSVRRQLEEFKESEEMRLAMSASSTWPPPRLTEPQIERLLNIQKTTGLEFDQALACEHVPFPKGPPPERSSLDHFLMWKPGANTERLFPPSS